MRLFGSRGNAPAAHAVSLTDDDQMDVPLRERQVPPAEPRPWQARTGAESVACARSEQIVFKLGKPMIAGVNKCGGLFFITCPS